MITTMRHRPTLLLCGIICSFLCNNLCHANHSTTAVPSTTSAPITLKEIELPECPQSQFKFIYTKCNENKQRWRILVPEKFSTCKISSPPSPKRGKDCGFRCADGDYLDIESENQECKPCIAGTYSVGGRKSFSNWEKLPEGFTSWGIDPDDDSPDDSEGSPCKGRQWKANGDVISSSGDDCKSVLVYSVDLDSAGNLTFKYRSQTDSSYFHVYAVNGYCSKNLNEQLFPRLSSEWTMATMSLKAGRNIIYWEAAYFDTERPSLSGSPDKSKENYDSNDEKKVEIKYITITGLPYLAECKPCDAGTYSGPGASMCKKCEKNTYSHAGASVCTECEFNQYSEAGSSSCKVRPLCSAVDYYETWTSCDGDMKTKHIYDWVQPKICDSGSSGAIALPASSGKVDCPPCNPGQFLNGSHCSFCPTGWYGAGNTACKKCPVGTTPNTGIYYKYWTSITKDAVKFGCYSKFERGCKSDVGWVLSQNYADSGTGHSDDAELVMVVTVPGFKKAYSLFVIEFELLCKSKCRLTLSEYHYRRGVHTVRSWIGAKGKTKFIHHIKSTEKIKFRLSFEKPYAPDEISHDNERDRMKLYSLTITNTENGGANECEQCTLGTKNSKCIMCGGGKYLDGSGVCQSCANGYFFNSTLGTGPEACQQCPFGTKVNPSGTGCYSDCHVYMNGRHFDLTNLQGSALMKGANLFTGKGFPYYHVFNITICGLDLVECRNNVSLPKDDDSDNSQSATQIISSICRSTVIPSKREGNLLTQSVSLAESIGVIHYGKAAIKDLLSELPTSASKNNSLTVANSTHEDIHFVYKFSTITPHCTSGFRSIVTLRCDPAAKGRGVIKPPAKCPHGTCDGCIFRFFWHTENACPKCTSLDYQNITAACKNGKVLVHHNWKENPRMCRGGDDLPASEERPCTLFETPILDFKIFLMIFLCLAVLLCMLVVFLCYRNRRLQYKYHRLVDGGGQNDGELPAVEKCALDDDEEDEDEVILARNPRGTNHILDRLKKFKGKNNFDEFESMQMRSQSDDESSH